MNLSLEHAHNLNSTYTFWRRSNAGVRQKHHLAMDTIPKYDKNHNPEKLCSTLSDRHAIFLRLLTGHIRWRHFVPGQGAHLPCHRMNGVTFLTFVTFRHRQKANKVASDISIENKEGLEIIVKHGLTLQMHLGNSKPQ
jgi:hypothetical protein